MEINTGNFDNATFAYHHTHLVMMNKVFVTSVMRTNFLLMSELEARLLSLRGQMKAIKKIQTSSRASSDICKVQRH